MIRPATEIMFADWISDKGYHKVANGGWIELKTGTTVAINTIELFNRWNELYRARYVPDWIPIDGLASPRKLNHD